jgi:hypothetical protein
MPTTSAPVSKRVRFEIFKRDGFTCQYCNRKPPDVTLEVDHIDPRALGGSNEEINLITACWDCNRGKAAKSLQRTGPRPDADLEYLKCQQELMEARRFLAAKQKLDSVKVKLVATIQAHWDKCLCMDDHDVPSQTVVLEWLTRYSADEIIAGIDKFIPAYRRTPWKFGPDLRQAIRYVSAIMRNRREEAV